MQALRITACGVPLRGTSCPVARMIWTPKLLLLFFPPLCLVFATVKPSHRAHTAEAVRQLFIKYIAQFQMHSQEISSSSESIINSNWRKKKKKEGKKYGEAEELINRQYKQTESNDWNRKLSVILQSQDEVEIPEHPVACIMADVFPAGVHGNCGAWLHFPAMLLHPDCLLGCMAFPLFLPVSKGSPGSREQ